MQATLVTRVAQGVSRRGESGWAGSRRPAFSPCRPSGATVSRGTPGPARSNLFVWLVITAYLFWGCDSRYRLLGLAVLPPAVCLLVAAWLGGATKTHADGAYSSAFLVLHVGLVLAAFAGFTVSAGLAALYLWQERRLKLRRAGALLGRAPSLVTLDALEGRVIAFAVPALTAGIVAGFVRLRSHGGSVDALMVVTVLTWALFTGYLVLRHAYSWRGRRAAYLVLAGFALVAVARLALPLTHFA